MIIGKAVFKKDCPKKLISPEIQTLMKNDNFWAIDHRKYQKQSWNLIFQDMQQVTVKTLILDYNNNKGILMEISHTNFSHLKQLWLRENKISNIEAIQYLQAPNLELLRISMNQIRKIQPLLKIQSKKLKQIYIPDNPIQDLNLMSKINLNNEMNDIFLQYWPHNNIISQDISFIVKLKSKSIHDLWIKGEDRISQIKIYQMINGKYPKLKIYKKQQ